MKYATALAVALSVVGLGAKASVLGTDLVTNGDFEAFTPTTSADYTQVNLGFTSSFTGGTFGVAGYVIGTNPAGVNSSLGSYGDNTSGAGNMMIVNGSFDDPAAPNMLWSQTLTVHENVTYAFGAAIASAFAAPLGALDLVVNGSVIGSITAGSTIGDWADFSFDWDSGTATSAVLELIETSEGFGGNDYMVDDISFVGKAFTNPPPSPIPLPAAMWALLAGVASLAAFRRRRV